MEYNLFDKYHASKDVKLHILLHLTEIEIHGLMGSVNKDCGHTVQLLELQKTENGLISRYPLQSLMVLLKNQYYSHPQ